MSRYRLLVKAIKIFPWALLLLLIALGLIGLALKH